MISSGGPWRMATLDGCGVPAVSRVIPRTVYSGIGIPEPVEIGRERVATCADPDHLPLI
jgi:hypothetical protein